MKAVFLLAVLTVFLLLPEVGDAWLIRHPWRRFKDKVRSGWRKVKNTLKSGFRKVNDKVQGRRDLDDYDLNQDGALDQAELETMIGERHARDLWQLMDADDSVNLDEFERHVRELDELEEEDE